MFEPGRFIDPISHIKLIEDIRSIMTVVVIELSESIFKHGKSVYEIRRIVL
jgi:hypothetical protein